MATSIPFRRDAAKRMPSQMSAPQFHHDPNSNKRGKYNDQREGDWECSCGEYNFKCRTVCRSCDNANPNGRGDNSKFSNDWKCPNCNEHNFARRDTCRKCHLTKDQATSASAASSTDQAKGARPANWKAGDWSCDQCQEHNFASRVLCRSCGKTRDGLSPDAGVETSGKPANWKPGDWICDNCGDHMFASRKQCRQCGAPQPGGQNQWGGGPGGGPGGGQNRWGGGPPPFDGHGGRGGGRGPGWNGPPPWEGPPARGGGWDGPPWEGPPARGGGWDGPRGRGPDNYGRDGPGGMGPNGPPSRGGGWNGPPSRGGGWNGPPSRGGMNQGGPRGGMNQGGGPRGFRDELTNGWECPTCGTNNQSQWQMCKTCLGKKPPQMVEGSGGQNSGPKNFYAKTQNNSSRAAGAGFS